MNKLPPGYDAWRLAYPPHWDYECEICNRHPDDCECPKCPVCDESGDPDCQINGGDYCQYEGE